MSFELTRFIKFGTAGGVSLGSGSQPSHDGFIEQPRFGYSSIQPSTTSQASTAGWAKVKAAKSPEKQRPLSPIATDKPVTKEEDDASDHSL